MVLSGNHLGLAVHSVDIQDIARFSFLLHRQTFLFFDVIRWNNAAAVGDDWYRNHPSIPTRTPSRRIPVGIHGDDAGVQGQAQVFTLTWGSLVLQLPTLDSRIIFTMVAHKRIPNHCGCFRNSHANSGFHVL